MNVQQYASILTRFNRVPAVEATVQNVFLIHWKEFKWESSLVGRLRYFESIVYHGTRLDSRPWIRALKDFYRTDCVMTTFLSRRKRRTLQQTVLMGNERILIPVEKGGEVHLCIFPFFVRDPEATLRLKGGAGGLYPYRDGILFADRHQVPFPGHSYHDEENDTPNDYGRLCFLTRHLDSVSEVFSDWHGKRGVLFFPFQTKATALKLVSDFFPEPKPLSNVCFPNTHLKSSATVRKTLSRHDPHFLLQDVLDTYGEANASPNASGKPLDNVALLIEYPFVSGFENNCGERGGCVVGNVLATDDRSSCSSNPFGTGNEEYATSAAPRYVPFLVNGLNPKTILQVKHPYDRYMEYKKLQLGSILNQDWTVFLYEPDPRVSIPSYVKLVRIENTILGYKYKNVFLCLSYPMLTDSILDEEGSEYFDDDASEDTCDPSTRPSPSFGIRNKTHENTDCLLNAVETFHPKKDPRLIVLGTYDYDEEYDIYQVELFGIRNELWCLVRKKEVENLESCHYEPSASSNNNSCSRNTTSETENPTKYFKKANSPHTHFVSRWMDFFFKNVHKKKAAYGNMDVFRLVMVLCRHKICCNLKLAKSRNVRLQKTSERSIELRGKDYVFYLDQPAIDYINEMRLSNTTREMDQKEEENKCTVS